MIPKLSAVCHAVRSLFRVGSIETEINVLYLLLLYTEV